MNTSISMGLQTYSTATSPITSPNQFSRSASKDTTTASSMAGVMVAATIMGSAYTLPPIRILPDSAVSPHLINQLDSARRARRLSQDAVTTFNTALQKRSKSLSSEDSQLLRQIILSKSKSGIPHF